MMIGHVYWLIIHVTNDYSRPLGLPIMIGHVYLINQVHVTDYHGSPLRTTYNDWSRVLD